jgi:hypothetical protein
MKGIKTFISLSLNPCDQEGQKIIDCMERILIDRKEEDIKELEKRVAFLLKHDWERVKKEVGIPHKNVDRSILKISLTGMTNIKSGFIYLIIETFKLNGNYMFQMICKYRVLKK